MTKKSEDSNSLVRLQHKHRSGPGEYILAGGGKFELDADGFVDVTPEAATAMLSAIDSHWRPVWENRTVDPSTVPVITNGARAPRTAEQLRGLAASEGLVPPPATNSVPTVPLSEEDTADLEEVARVPGPNETGDHAFVAAVIASIDGAPADADPAAEPITIHEGMSRAELRAAASQVGVEVSAHASKAQIFAALVQQSTEA